ncbi:uncharacterized protein LOC130966366 [Arachis stenosperma]|uniref:uncharacterized protein LOC130966366 n=1 Tax=Arachis stenosperma TaxID=217475 RepID=UPI0025ACED55|nr:uncharacterized protein LOC130966366 [Arachis stenosperma]
MAASMQATIEVLGNQVCNGNDSNGGNGSMNLATFLKVNPPAFCQTTYPTEADNWFLAMERGLQAQHIPEDQYVEFATYQLIGKAQFWWQGARRLLSQGDAMIAWDTFRVEFYKKYFLSSVRAAKELELMQLKLGSMMVVEYTRLFEELCRFSRVC